MENVSANAAEGGIGGEHFCSTLSTLLCVRTHCYSLNLPSNIIRITLFVLRYAVNVNRLINYTHFSLQFVPAESAFRCAHCRAAVRHIVNGEHISSPRRFSFIYTNDSKWNGSVLFRLS